MKNSGFPKSVRKHIRKEKAVIAAIADPAMRAQKMAELRAKFGLPALTK